MQNPSTFKVYNASAGSGKTFTLVKEYLKILLATTDVKRFQSILAITFTNKAAAEMKERVLNNLRDFAKAEILQDKTNMFLKLEDELGLQDAKLHERAQKVLKSILNNYAAFNITTIDSFTYRLIRNFAFDLGLSLNFDVEMDAKSLLNEAVDTLISKIGEDKELTKILIDFSLQKANDDKSWDISRELKEIAQLLLNENDSLHVKALHDKSIDDFLTLKKQLKQKRKETENELKEIGKTSLEIISNAGLEPENFTRKTFPNFLKSLSEFSDKFDYLKRSATIEKAIEEHNFYTKAAKDNVKNAIESILPKLIKLFNQSKTAFGQKSLYELFLKNIIPLTVLSKINESLNELKEDKNVRLNAEFNEIISNHLVAQPAAFIYERLGERYKHYFIDEMQDTSKLQWFNLIPLIDNALSQENSSLLLVGDAKQSIYRWRGGEAAQFIGLSKDVNPFHVEKKSALLDTNFRSYSEVIEFNNSFFQFLSKYFSNEDYQHIYKQENQQKTTNKQGGYVQLSFLEEGLKKEDRDELYPEKVLQIIKEAQADFSLNEMCIITRKRDQGITIANYLTENGIDIISSETLLLQNSNKVQFIIDVLTFLQQQSNKEAKFDVLFFLHEHLKIQTDKHSFFTECIHLETSEFFEKLNEKGTNFKYADFNALPFYESIEAIVSGFNLTKTSDAYIQFFLDEVLQYSIKKSEGAQGFLSHWEEKKDKLSIVVPEEKNAVRIMTIHKSKGLEFPVVIFPYDLDIYYEINPKTWYPVEEKLDFSTLLVDNTKKLAETSDLGEQLFLNRKSASELDNINLLYVTLTRAVEQLYIISEQRKSVDEPKYYSQFFIEYLKFIGKFDAQQSEYEFGVKKRVSTKEQSAKNSVELDTFISSSWQDHNINIVATSSLLWDSERGASIVYGNLIHEILSEIKTNLDIEDAIEVYVNNGTILSAEAEKIKQIITKVVEHEQLKDYFSNDYTIYNEREILTSYKEVVKPDRFVVNNQNEAILIDYKTGKPDKKYHQQLALYEDALTAIGFKVTKKLLVYIDDEIVIDEVT